MAEKVFVVTDYLKFRAELRHFDLLLIEQIIRYGSERYYDVETQRVIVVGEHGDKLVMIPYEETEMELIPVTIHTTTRQQIKFRLTTGRLIYE
ncbi:MAG: hypothetical protein NTY50_10235 [Methylobacter sp.]|nr:hypothetical protein [Methylobacter sp.]